MRLIEKKIKTKLKGYELYEDVCVQLLKYFKEGKSIEELHKFAMTQEPFCYVSPQLAMSAVTDLVLFTFCSRDEQFDKAIDILKYIYKYDYQFDSIDELFPYVMATSVDKETAKIAYDLAKTCLKGSISKEDLIKSYELFKYLIKEREKSEISALMEERAKILKTLDFKEKEEFDLKHDKIIEVLLQIDSESTVKVGITYIRKAQAGCYGKLTAGYTKEDYVEMFEGFVAAKSSTVQD